MRKPRERSPGRWEISAEGPANADGSRGKPIFKTVAAKNRRDAERQTLALESQLVDGFVGEGSKISLHDFTVGHLVDGKVVEGRWLAYLRGQVRPSSVVRNMQRLTKFALPHIGAKMLSEIRPAHIQLLLDNAAKMDNRRGGTCKEQTIRGLRSTLNAVFGQAVRWQLITVNPVTNIRSPRVPRRDMRCLDGGAARMLIDTARGTRLETLVVVALGTGARRGELLGLRWSDIDLDAATARITRSVGPQGVISEPKTAAGNREVPLGATVVDALRLHRDRQLAELTVLADGDALTARRRQKDGAIFIDAFGRRPTMQALRLQFRALVAAAKLAPLRLHDLRHTCASLMLDAGIPVATVAKILGHSSPTITLSIYAHAIKGSDDRAAAALEAALTGR